MGHAKAVRKQCTAHSAGHRWTIVNMKKMGVAAAFGHLHHNGTAVFGAGSMVVAESTLLHGLTGQHNRTKISQKYIRQITTMHTNHAQMYKIIYNYIRI